MNLPGTFSDYLVHFGYTLMLMALLARDILWLRAILVVAQGTLAAYAFHRGVLPIAWWNVVFVAINSVWVVRILRERAAVRLPAELAELHAKYFSALLPQEFMRLWVSGESKLLTDAALMKEGARPDALYFVLRGEVLVAHGARAVTRLGPGSFVGEMSLLTGEACTADARTQGEAQLMCWPAARLQAVRERNPGFWAKIQSVLGHDIVEKIRRAAAAAG